ncbi:MAG: septum formation initiator family protein [Desulfobacteraceae bacterium]|nr:MAG: septum formation initiator family protein [Desulfobacteraceae bacterium]
MILAIASLVFFGLLAAILFSENGYMALKRFEKEKLALMKTNEAINAENLQLYRTIKRLKHDPQYIESVARQELGMTGKDEIIIKFKNKGTP